MTATGWTPRHTPEEMTKRLIRKIGLGLAFGLVLAGIAAHNNGYGILIAPSEQVDAPANGLAMMKCTYFTGTEKVINHVARRAKEGETKPTCPLYSMVGLGQVSGRMIPGMPAQPRDDLPGLGPNIQFDRTPATDAPPDGAPPAVAAPPASPAPSNNPGP